MPSSFSIFLDIGHAYGAKAGASANDIVEQEYNLEVRNRVAGVYTARTALEHLISQFNPYVPDINGFIQPLYYKLMVNTNDEGGLNGKYSERIKKAQNFGASAYIQMHCNSGGGKYAIVGYHNYGPMKEYSERMAEIFAEIYNSEIEKTSLNELLKDIQIWPCTSHHEDIGHRNIAACLSSASIPAILIEPFFLDNKGHAEYMKTDEGINLLSRTYLRAMDKIADEFTENVGGN